MTPTPDQRIVYLLEEKPPRFPAAEHWLSGREREVLDALNVPKRRQDWQLGRWTAKNALARSPLTPPRPMEEWEILAAADGAPEAWLDDEPAGVTLSLSHSHGQCLCAIGPPDLRMGCDIERIEQRSRVFEETFFTDAEIQLMRGQDDRGLMATLIWSAKESVLKALRTGLRSDTRRIRIEAIEPSVSEGWSRFQAIDAQCGDRFGGSWRTRGKMLMAITADQASSELLEL